MALKHLCKNVCSMTAFFRVRIEVLRKLVLGNADRRFPVCQSFHHHHDQGSQHGLGGEVGFPTSPAIPLAELQEVLADRIQDFWGLVQCHADPVVFLSILAYRFG